MCILEHVTDVEIFLSNLQKKKQLISLTRYFQNCFMYIFDGHCFYESLSSSFKSVMQFSSFFFCEDGPIAEKQKLGDFWLMFYNNLKGLSCRNIYGKDFLQYFLYRICDKVTLKKRKY